MKLVVVIGVNSDKHTMFPLDQRKKWLEESLKDLCHVTVQAHAGLATEICKEIKANVLIRGVRNGVIWNMKKYGSYESSVGPFDRNCYLVGQ